MFFTDRVLEVAVFSFTSGIRKFGRKLAIGFVMSLGVGGVQAYSAVVVTIRIIRQEVMSLFCRD